MSWINLSVNLTEGGKRLEALLQQLKARQIERERLRALAGPAVREALEPREGSDPRRDNRRIEPIGFSPLASDWACGFLSVLNADEKLTFTIESGLGQGVESFEHPRHVNGTTSLTATAQTGGGDPPINGFYSDPNGFFSENFAVVTEFGTVSRSGVYVRNGNPPPPSGDVPEPNEWPPQLIIDGDNAWAAGLDFYAGLPEQRRGDWFNNFSLAVYGWEILNTAQLCLPVGRARFIYVAVVDSANFRQAVATQSYQLRTKRGTESRTLTGVETGAFYDLHWSANQTRGMGYEVSSVVSQQQEEVTAAVVDTSIRCYLVDGATVTLIPTPEAFAVKLREILPEPTKTDEWASGITTFETPEATRFLSPLVMAYGAFQPDGDYYTFPELTTYSEQEWGPLQNNNSGLHVVIATPSIYACFEDDPMTEEEYWDMWAPEDAESFLNDRGYPVPSAHLVAFAGPDGFDDYGAFSHKTVAAGSNDPLSSPGTTRVKPRNTSQDGEGVIPLIVWDGGNPRFCQDKLLALGFSEADLRP